jgi:DUF4097 and DUF4098 domain-containing protein YvlB
MGTLAAKAKNWAGLAGLLAPLLLGLSATEPAPRFERSYSTNGAAHFTLRNDKGEIRLKVWDRRELLVRAKSGSNAEIADRVTGNRIEIYAKTGLHKGRTDFEVTVPLRTSVLLDNKVGDVNVNGLEGHLKVESVDGDVQLLRMQSQSVQVKVIHGDVIFEGDFAGRGPYTFQTMKGDVDLTLPSTTSFNFAAKAMRENIDLGKFQCNQCYQQPRFIAGNHLKGGPRVEITVFDGKILLHQR